METTEHTLHKNFVKNDLHLLLCDDDVWQNWVMIMRLYERGLLPNTKGETQTEGLDQNLKLPTLKSGQIQQAPGTVTLGPTLFRCILGLQKSEVLEIQTSLLEKIILLKKGKQTHQRMDMEEMAWKLKTDRVLKDAITAFYFDLTREKMTWEQVCDKYKLAEYEYNQLKIYSQSFVKDSLNRTKKNPSLPKSVVTLLNHLYRASMGIVSQQESIPWTIRGVGFDMTKITKFCSEEHVPFQLAIMDLHGTKEQLSAEFFSKLALAMNTLNSQYEYIFVCFVNFIYIAMLIEGISSQSTKLHYEFGVIHTQKDDAWMSGTVEIATVVLFISKVDKFEAIDKVLTKNVFASSSSGGQNKEFIDKGFIDGLITGLCPEHSYVIEIYCGGVVLEQSLLMKRRCIALCKDDLEAMALESRCSALLDNHPSLKEWCGASSNTKKQTLDDTEKENLQNIHIDDPPSTEEEDESDDSDSKNDTDDDKETGDAADFEDEEQRNEDVQGNVIVSTSVKNNFEDTRALENDDEGGDAGDILDTTKAMEASNVGVASTIEKIGEIEINKDSCAHSPSSSQSKKGRNHN